jgi:hypothetical protein
MSSPSGMSFNPFDLSPYAPKKARVRAAAGPNEPPVENGGDTVVPLPLATRAAEPDASEDRRSEELEAQSSPLPEPATGQSAQSQATDEPAHDPDLDRLESSLRWLQRETEASRLPRAHQLPPVFGLRSVAPDGTSRDQFINGMRVPPSLARERLKPPPAMRARRDHLRAPLRVLVASLLALPIAYYAAVGKVTWSPSPSPQQPAREAELGSLASKVVTSPQFPLPKDEVRPGETQDYNSMLASRNRAEPRPDAASPPASTPAVDLPAEPPAAAAPVLADAQSTPLRELDPEEIKHLLQQGQQYVAAGDVASARQVFLRAAEAGNAAAALAMGATFDPTALAKLGAAGIGADVGKAREWYEKARIYGSADAARRLDLLANR